MAIMGEFAITAHTSLLPGEAQAVLLTWFDELGLELAYAEDDLMIAWLDDSIDPGYGGTPRSPSLVVQAQIHPLLDGVKVRWCVRHGDGTLAAELAAAAEQVFSLCLSSDRRWVIDGREGPLTCADAF